jgi:rhodanese-related sulfurtransferase
MNAIVKFLVVAMLATCTAVFAETATIAPDTLADQLPNRIAELVGAKDKDIVVYCRSGRRAALAQQALAEQGFKRVLHLEGDIVKWQDENRPVEK